MLIFPSGHPLKFRRFAIGPTFTDAKDKPLTKRVIEKTGIVTTARSLPALVPVGAIRGGVNKPRLPLGPAEIKEPLELDLQFGLVIQPDQTIISTITGPWCYHRVGSRNNIQFGFFPV